MSSVLLRLEDGPSARVKAALHSCLSFHSSGLMRSSPEKGPSQLPRRWTFPRPASGRFYCSCGALQSSSECIRVHLQAVTLVTWVSYRVRAELSPSNDVLCICLKTGRRNHDGCPEMDIRVREWTTCVGKLFFSSRTFFFFTHLNHSGLATRLAKGVFRNIARQDSKKQKLRGQIIVATVAFFVRGVATYGFSRQNPAAPLVERSTVW